MAAREPQASGIPSRSRELIPHQVISQLLFASLNFLVLVISTSGARRNLRYVMKKISRYRSK
jgi:hypothetical protein